MPGPVTDPELSVVVSIVDGGPTLGRCLDALERQVDSPRLEVLIPWDSTITEIEALAPRYPRFRFLPMGSIATDRPAASFAGRHELIDRRRAAGLAAATAPLVGMLQDQGVPEANWARAMVTLHGSVRAAAIGGAIENGLPNALSSAVYYCDFGRYQRPFESGPRDYVSNVNICYRRDALTRVRQLWTDRYHETTVNWALAKSGEPLLLSPEPIVAEHREGLRLGALLRERLAFGRLFGYTRARESSIPQRVLLSLGAPIVPLVLFARLLAGRLDRNRLSFDFIRATPVIGLLLVAWSLGEAMGYLTGRP